jgi:hypothetical protein
MFNNKDGSPAFYAFLDLIAKRHRVEDWKEWKEYAGGLNNQTGKECYYTKWQDAEVILHVSTLLPYAPDDPQKLERKRHLGNDVVICIFRDGPGPQLSPALFQSHFNRTPDAVLFRLLSALFPAERHLLCDRAGRQWCVQNQRVVQDWRQGTQPASAS